MRKLILTATVVLLAGLPGRLTATSNFSQSAGESPTSVEKVAAAAVTMEMNYGIPAHKFIDKVQKGELTLVQNGQGDLIVKDGGSILAVLEDF